MWVSNLHKKILTLQVLFLPLLKAELTATTANHKSLTLPKISNTDYAVLTETKTTPTYVGNVNAHTNTPLSIKTAYLRSLFSSPKRDYTEIGVSSTNTLSLTQTTKPARDIYKSVTRDNFKADAYKRYTSPIKTDNQKKYIRRQFIDAENRGLVNKSEQIKKLSYQHYYSQQPGYYSQQPGYYNQQLGYYNQQPGYYKQQQGYYNQQPGYYNQQPGYYNQQLGYFNQQPGYYNQQPGYYNQQPGYYGPAQVANYGQNNQQNLFNQKKNLPVQSSSLSHNPRWREHVSPQWAGRQQDFNDSEDVEDEKEEKEDDGEGGGGGGEGGGAGEGGGGGAEGGEASPGPTTGTGQEIILPDGQTYTGTMPPGMSYSPGMITEANEAQGAATRFSVRITTKGRIRRTTPYRISLIEDCDYLYYYCLKAYETGWVCAKSGIGLTYLNFRSYCLLDYVNCMERYTIWVPIYMGKCTYVPPLTSYKEYEYNDESFLQNYFIVEDV